MMRGSTSRRRRTMMIVLGDHLSGTFVCVTFVTWLRGRCSRVPFIKGSIAKNSGSLHKSLVCSRIFDHDVSLHYVADSRADEHPVTMSRYIGVAIGSTTEQEIEIRNSEGQLK